MSADEVSPAPVAAATAEEYATWVTREAPRVYRGHNDRGQTVLMGPRDEPGAFTPGELLKIALAGCAGMTADGVIARRIGADAPVTIGVTTQNHETEDRFTRFDETVRLDLSGLSNPQRAELAVVVERAIGRGCTVGLTLLSGADIFVDIRQA